MTSALVVTANKVFPKRFNVDIESFLETISTELSTPVADKQQGLSTVTMASHQTVYDES